MKIGVSGPQKMPPEAYSFASDAINDLLRNRNDVVGICSLAAGADQLFAKAIIDHGHQLHVVVPCENYGSTFDAEGLSLYEDLLASAVSNEKLDFDSPSEEAFYAAGKRVTYLADELIAVWDGEVSQGLGGTADIVAYARKLDKAVHIIWPDGVKR